MTPQTLEDIHSVIIHCSATREDEWITAKMIDTWHREQNGWSMIGYHRVIRLDGAVEQGRPLERRGAHVAGNNVNTIGICMIGGLDQNGFAKDTYNGQQYTQLYRELVNIKMLCPNITSVKGHRDYSPDLNGDGLIGKSEWIKECPCFDVRMKLEGWRLTEFLADA